MQIFKKIKRIRNNPESQNAEWLIWGRIFQMAISFVVSIFTTRYLGPANFGLINYADAYIAFFTSLCTLGINSVIIKKFFDEPDNVGTIIGSTLGLRLISSFLSMLMIDAIVSFVDRGENVTISVVVLCSISLLFKSFDTINYWFQAQYKSKITAIATLIAYIITLLYKIVLLVLHKNVLWFAFASSLDFIVMAVILLVEYKKYKGPGLHFSIKTGKELLNSSYHFILSGLMVAIYGQTDKMMLKQMLNETSVGYYSLASTINTFWVFILQAIIDSITPTIFRLFKTDKDGFDRKNRQLYAIVIYLSLFVAIIFTLFGQFAIKIVYGDDFLGAVEPLNIICWYTAFSYLGVARNAWIVCHNAQKYLKYLYGAAVVINIGLNALMIPSMGASGAALASLITQIFTSVILPFAIKELRPNVKLMAQALLLRGVK